MSYCPNCGKKLECEVFCSECGTKIWNDNFIENKKYNNVKDIYEHTENNAVSIGLWNKYCRTKVISIASISVFVLCIFAGIFFNYEVKATQKRADGISFKQAVMVNDEVTILDKGINGVLANDLKAKKEIPLLKFMMFLFFFISAISFIYGIYFMLVSIKLKQNIKNHNQK